MKRSRGVRESLGVIAPFSLVLSAGCHTAAPSAPHGYWSRQAERIAAERLHEHAPSGGPPLQRWGTRILGSERKSFVLAADSAETDALPHSLAADEGAPTTAPAPVAARSDIARGPLPDFGDTVIRDVKRMPRELWHDTKRVYTDVGNLLILGVAGGASIALRPEVDDDIEDHYDRHHAFRGDWPDTFATLGNPGVHFALAGVMYLAGQQLPDTKTYEVGRTLFSALTINGVSTVLLKLAACTEAPNGENWAWPSGHVSSTMTVAAVMHEAYGPWAGIPLYGLTGLVAVERMDSGEHHFSDVVFGAAMGWVIGHTVAAGRRPEIFGGEIIPYADPNTGSAGIAWFKSFK